MWTVKRRRFNVSDGVNEYEVIQQGRIWLDICRFKRLEAVELPGWRETGGESRGEKEHNEFARKLRTAYCLYTEEEPTEYTAAAAE